MSGAQAARAAAVYVAWLAVVGAAAWAVSVATFELCGGRAALEAGVR